MLLSSLILFVHDMCNNFEEFAEEAKKTSRQVEPTHSDKRSSQCRDTNQFPQMEKISDCLLSGVDKSRLETFYIILDKLQVLTQKLWIYLGS